MEVEGGGGRGPQSFGGLEIIYISVGRCFGIGGSFF